MITIEEACAIQKILIERFGGASGVRDKGLLESALNRTFQTFNGEDLYISTIEKSATLIESLITNNPFIDGNKRFTYVAMRILLLEEALEIDASEDDKYNFVISIAKGEIKYDDICIWIRNNIK